MDAGVRWPGDRPRSATAVYALLRGRAQRAGAHAVAGALLAAVRRLDRFATDRHDRADGRLHSPFTSPMRRSERTDADLLLLARGADVAAGLTVVLSLASVIRRRDRSRAPTQVHRRSPAIRYPGR